jgi:hypothetical protein
MEKETNLQSTSRPCMHANHRFLFRRCACAKTCCFYTIRLTSFYRYLCTRNINIYGMDSTCRHTSSLPQPAGDKRVALLMSARVRGDVTLTRSHD